MDNLINKFLAQSKAGLLSFSLDDKEKIYFQDFIKDLQQMYTKLADSKEQTWLIHFDNSYFFSVAFLALILNKKTPVLSANTNRNWLSSINSDFEAIISDNELSHVTSKPNYLFKKSNNLTTASFIAPQVDVQSEVVFYTSGSSGRPKKIVKHIQLLLNEIENLEQTFGSYLSPSIFLSTVSHQHIYGLLFRVLWPLLNNRPFCCSLIEYQEQLEPFYPEKNICLISSPAFLSRLDSELNTKFIKSCFSSGSLLDFTASQESLQALSSLPIEVYGSTETGGIAYRQQVAVNSPWSLFSGINLRAANNTAELDTPYVAGNGWLELDDLILLHSERSFSLLGRSDSVIKIAEKRVSLLEIESSIESSNLVRRAFALTLDNQSNTLCCIVQLTELGLNILESSNKHFIVNALKKHLSEYFDSVIFPKKWRLCESLPFNTQGKICKSELMKCFTQLEKA